MKRVLHISNYYPPHVGGIENVCRMVVQSLPQHEHIVICFNDLTKTEVSICEGVKVLRVGTFLKLAGQAIPWNYLWKLRSLIRSFNPDIIHFHAPNPLISLYLLLVMPRHVKLVVHYHAEILTSPMLYACYKPIENLFFKRANVILATSPKLRDEAKPLAAVRNKCDVFANCIDTTLFDLSKDDECKVAGIRNLYGNKKIVFTYGRHVEYKGLEYLIRADQHIKNDCVILIGGKGPLTGYLQTLPHSDRLHFLGYISDEQLKYYLYAADVFAFPSITRAEAFGLTLLESMYCYTPPVTFTITASGVNYVSLNGETGLEVENSNPVAFAAAIDCLLSDPLLKHRLAENGHGRVVELFSMPKFSRKIQEIYERL